MYYPTGVAAVVPYYNLGDDKKLVLDGAALAGIFGGWIAYWNDSAIVALNPSAQLPGVPITVIMTSVKSGAQYVFTKGLADMDSRYNTTYGGAELPPVWSPTSSRLKLVTNTEMVLRGKATRYSMGFALYREVVEAGLAIPSLYKMGKLIPCSAETVYNANLEIKIGGVPALSPSYSWPIIGYTYFLVRSQSNFSCTARRELVRFMLWWYQSEDNRNVQNKFSFVVLPPVVQDELQIEKNLRSTVFCDGGVLAYPAAQLNDGTFLFSSIIQRHTDIAVSAYIATGAQFRSVLNTSDSLVSWNSLVSGAADLVFLVPTAATRGQKSTDNLIIQPVFAGGQVLTTSVGGKATVNMTRDIIVRILTGTVRTLNHASITAINPAISASLFPSDTIRLVVTNDSDSTPFYKSFCSMWTAQKAPIVYDTCVEQMQGWGLVTGYGVNVTLVSSTKMVDQMVLSVPGAIGITWLDPLISSTIVTLLDNATNTVLAPNSNSFGACFSPAQFAPLKEISATAHAANIADPSCWPFAQQIAFATRLTATGSCTKFTYLAKFASWYLNNVGVSEDLKRNLFSPLPASAFQPANDTLSTASCNGKTVLVVTPEIWSLPPTLKSAVLSLAVVVMIAALICQVLLFVHRKEPVIRAATPLFLVIVLIGVQVFCGFPIAYTSDASNSSCGLTVWLAVMGFSIMFSPLFIKAFRVYRIFSNRKTMVLKITDMNLLRYLVAIGVFDVILLLVWQGTSPWSPRTWLGDLLTIYTSVTECGSSDLTIPYILLASKGLLVMWGCYIAFVTRNVASDFNESKYTSMAVYNMLFSMGLLIPILLLIRSEREAVYFLVAFCGLWIALATLLLFFLPKFLRIYLGNEAFESSASQSASGIRHSGSKGPGTVRLHDTKKYTISVGSKYVRDNNTTVNNTSVNSHNRAQPKSLLRQSSLFSAPSSQVAPEPEQ